MDLDVFWIQKLATHVRIIVGLALCTFLLETHNSQPVYESLRVNTLVSDIPYSLVTGPIHTQLAKIIKTTKPKVQVWATAGRRGSDKWWRTCRSLDIQRASRNDAFVMEIVK